MVELTEDEKFVITNNEAWLEQGNFDKFLQECGEDKLHLGYTNSEVDMRKIISWFDDDPNCFPFNDIGHGGIWVSYSEAERVSTTKDEIVNEHLTDFSNNRCIVFCDCPNLKRLCLPNLTTLDLHVLLNGGFSNLEYIDISKLDDNVDSLFYGLIGLAKPLTIKVKNRHIAILMEDCVWYKNNSKLISFEYADKGGN